MDDSITKDPKAEFTGLHNQMLSSKTLLQIYFLDVSSITTCLQLKQMGDNSQSSLLKSFKGYNTVLARINEGNQQNVVGHSTWKW